MMLTIVGVYLALLLGIGWWCHRHRIAGMTDFLLAGRKLGVVLCAAAMAAGILGDFDFDVGGVPTEIYAALVSAVLFVAVSLLTARSEVESSRIFSRRRGS